MIGLFVLAHASELPSISSWTVLESEPPTVKCAADGTPWCESTFQIECGLTTVEGLLSDFSRYPVTFPRVLSANVLEPDVVHIRVDMPFPLYARDYIAHFRRQKLDNGVRFWWTSVTHTEAPEREDTVRLPNAAGSWTVEQQQVGQSMVHYFWNAEIGLDIPSWALPRARRTQGQEVMYWLQDACNRSK